MWNISSCSVWMTLLWDKILELAFLFEVFHNMFYLKPAALTILLAVHKLLKAKRIERTIGAKYFIWVLDRKGMKLFSIFFFLFDLYLADLFMHLSSSCSTRQTRTYFHTCVYTLTLSRLFFTHVMALHNVTYSLCNFSISSWKSNN